MAGRGQRIVRVHFILSSDCPDGEIEQRNLSLEQVAEQA